MAIATGTIALGVAIAGLGVTAYGTVAQQSAQKDASKASQEAEALRRRQMELENLRKQREIIRSTARARAQALGAAVNRGVGLESSVVSGALGQISGETGNAILAQSQNTAIGRSLFDANAQLSEARGAQQTAAGIQDFGKTLFGSAQTIGNIAGSVGTTSDIGPWDTLTRDSAGNIL